MAGSRCATILPKSSPYVGHYRHAPPSPVPSELADRLQGLLGRARKTQDTKEPVAARPLSLLPKNSPFVGYQRHAPESPRMCPMGSMSPMSLEPAALPADILPADEAFSLNDDGPLGLFFIDDNIANLDNDEEDSFCLQPLADQLDPEEDDFTLDDPFPALFKKKSAVSSKKSKLALDQYLPHDALCQVIQNIATTKMLPSLLSASHAFHEATRSPQTWQGIPVSLPPAAAFYRGRHIPKYVAMWQQAEKIMMPRCSKLSAEFRETCPDVPREFIWRFDSRLKGCGVTVKNNGKTACRTDDDKVVVLGDAPIRNSYLEVFLDERDEDMSWENQPNDFGLGVTSSHQTACEELKQGNLEVAGEFPHSWVVDFSKNSIFLVINNENVARHELFGAADIHKGDRVGLKLERHLIRVYVNGKQEATLTVPDHAPIEPMGTLYPVFDLYGRTKQMTYSEASSP